MTTITTRAGKGSPLLNSEVDANFTNLNDDKAELSGAAFTGPITTNSTVDGRDVATDGTKLDGIEASADVTDTANVTAAGALMDSELTSEAAVKALNQGVATTDSPTFAGVTVNGTVEFDGLSGTGSVTVTDILDQDDMSGNSATALATQQSIKAYVDSQVATADTLSEVLANGNTTGGTNIAFGDNDKAIFGAGSDLQIFHDSNNSYIKDAGTGYLVLGGQDTGVAVQNGSGQNLILTGANAVTLSYGSASKLATTSTGIDVTGTVTADGAEVIGDVAINTTTPATYLHIVPTDGELNDVFEGFRVSRSTSLKAAQFSTYSHAGGSATITSTVTTNSASGSFRVLSSADGSTTKSLLHISNGNDVSFYEDTGTTAKLFWDASAESLGIGTSSPNATLDLEDASTGDPKMRLTCPSTGNPAIEFRASDSWQITSKEFDSAEGYQLDINYNRNVYNGGLTVSDNGTERFRIDASGLVGIGNSSASSFTGASAQNLVVGSGSGHAGMTVYSGTTSVGGLAFADGTSAGSHYRGLVQYRHSEDAMLLYTSETERMRIDSSGTLNLGTTLNVFGGADRYGYNFYANGQSNQSIDGTGGAVAQYINRENADGPFTEYYKDRVKVGSIGTTGGDMYVGTGDCAIRFSDGGDQIRVCTNTGSNRDGAIDLGFTDSRFKDLYLSGTAYASGATFQAATPTLRLQGTSNTNKNITVRYNESSDYGQINVDEAGVNQKDLWITALNIKLGRNTSSESARIDSSGNLLVGKTSTTLNTAGAYIAPSGVIVATRDSAEVLALNLTNSDGNIASFYKDGTTVGSIGAKGGTAYLIGSSKGLRVSGSGVIPITTGGTNSDATYDIGDQAVRFKDLYLSGGVYLGGTGSANKLDDYEEGTFTPTVIGTTTAGTATYSFQKGAYTKVGDLVHVQIYLNWSGGTGAGNLQFSGLPFTLFASSGYYASASIAEASGIAGTAGHQLGGLGVPNTTTINWVEFDFNSAPTGLAYDAAGYIVCSMSYRAV